jgi:hypothetical protein
MPGRQYPNQVAVAVEYAYGGQASRAPTPHHVQHDVHRCGELAVQGVAWHAAERGQRL